VDDLLNPQDLMALGWTPKNCTRSAAVDNRAPALKNTAMGGTRTLKETSPEAVSPQNSGGGGSAGGSAPSGKIAETPPADPELRAVVEAWPELSKPIKAAIMAMVRESGNG